MSLSNVFSVWAFYIFNRFIESVIHAEVKFSAGFIDPGGNTFSVAFIHTPVVIASGELNCNSSSVEYNTNTILLSRTLQTVLGYPWVQGNCLMRPGGFELEQVCLHCHSQDLSPLSFSSNQVGFVSTR